MDASQEADEINVQSRRWWRVWLLSPVDCSPSREIQQLWQQFVGQDGDYRYEDSRKKIPFVYAGCAGVSFSYSIQRP